MSDEPQPQQPNEGVAPEKPLPAEGPGKPGGHEEKAAEQHTDRPRRPEGAGAGGAASTGGTGGTKGARRGPGTPDRDDSGRERSGRPGGEPADGARAAGRAPQDRTASVARARQIGRAHV